MTYVAQQQAFYQFLSQGYWLVALVIVTLAVRKMLRNHLVFRTVVALLLIVPVTVLEICQWLRQ